MTSASKVRPLRDHIIVRYAEPELRTASGIYLPQDSTPGKRPVERGTVLAVGPKVTLVSVGDEVLFDKDFGENVSFDGHSCRVCREEDILAVLDS